MSGPGWPNERGWLVIAGMVLFIYVLSLLAFIPRLEDSQLFAALAGGVVGAILRDVFGMWTSATKAGSDLATKAMDTLQIQTAAPPADPKPVPSEPGGDAPAEEGKL